METALLLEPCHIFENCHKMVGRLFGVANLTHAALGTCFRACEPITDYTEMVTTNNSDVHP